MTIYETILLVFTVAGITFGITRSNLFKEPREWATKKHKEKNRVGITGRFYWIIDALLNCQRCNAFWVSILVYIVILNKLYFLCYPFCMSIIIYWVHQLTKNLK